MSASESGDVVRTKVRLFAAIYLTMLDTWINSLRIK